MWNRTRIAPVTIFSGVLLLGVAVSRAERAPEDRQQATDVVIGNVEGVYLRREGRTVHYLVEIVIDKVEKGNLKAGETLYVRCYLWDPDWFKGKKLSEAQQKQLALEGPAYDGVPKEGARVKVYVKHRGGKYVGVYPDWYDVKRE